MPLCHRRRLKFLHVPKTGGTALVKALDLEHTGYHDGWWDYPGETKDYCTFAVVREPLARFVSQYNYAMSQETVWHKQGTQHEYPDLQALREMTLLEVVDDLRKPLQKRLLKECGWWTQSQFIFNHQEDLQCDYLLRYEELEADLAVMLRRQNLKPISIPPSNVSQKTITRGDLLVNKQFLERFVSVYDRDFELLGYERPLRGH